MPGKILITGSNGLLGQKLVLAFGARSGTDLVATSKGDNRLRLKDGYRYESLDVTDHTDVEAAIVRHAPKIIIHTAAMTNVDNCEKEKESCWKLNVEAVRNLVRVCEKRKIHLIHLSTDFIFDGRSGPYKEDDSPHPLSYYAESKYASEKLLTASSAAWTIIRTILLYGMSEDSERSNIVLWVKASLEKGETIRVVTDHVRMPTLAEDLAEACVAAALKKTTGIYHVSGKDMLSMFDLAKTVGNFFGLDVSLVHPTTSEELNLPAKRPAVTGFILDKAIRDLNYRPHSFLDGLAIVKAQLKERTLPLT